MTQEIPDADTDGRLARITDQYMDDPQRTWPECMVVSKTGRIIGLLQYLDIASRLECRHADEF